MSLFRRRPAPEPPPVIEAREAFLRLACAAISDAMPADERPLVVTVYSGSADGGAMCAAFSVTDYRVRRSVVTEVTDADGRTGVECTEIPADVSGLEAAG